MNYKPSKQDLKLEYQIDQARQFFLQAHNIKAKRRWARKYVDLKAQRSKDYAEWLEK